MTAAAAAPEAGDEVTERPYDAALLRRLLRYLRPYRPQAALAVGLLVVGGLLALAGPWLTQQALDVAIPRRDAGLLRLLTLAFVGALALDFAVQYVNTLLTTHIEQAVPVLQAAQAGDQAALDQALSDWYANAKEIADFLSSANPENWPTSATEPMMKSHIDQTTAYSVDLLKGDYALAVNHYDEAFDHMMMLADVLADGIRAQFPNRFK